MVNLKQIFLQSLLEVICCPLLTHVLMFTCSSFLAKKKHMALIIKNWMSVNIDDSANIPEF